MEQKFYICGQCGNIITKVKNSGVSVVCCGEEMTELVPGTVDTLSEKHVPVYEVKDHKVYVKIGEIEHPMIDAHHIEWIFLQTNKGNQFKRLSPNCKPEAVFAILDDEKVEAVYAYCNVHGFWKK